MIARPEWLFDRDTEWERLANFVDRPWPGAALAVVYGRRRQGKTTLLEALTDASGGYYWQAGQQSSQQNLRSFSDAYSRWAGAPGRMRFAGWEDALASAFALGTPDRPALLLLDEFGYLLDTAPEVASLIQAQLSPRASRSGYTRVVLCGSAFAQMRALIGPDAPLRGRASLELVVGPFGYRAAARFWGLDDNPVAAFRLHALIGGTPGYRLLAGETPARGNVDRWAIEHLLAPTSPLHREGRIVIAEDPTLTDRALYWGVLAAVADGSCRRNDIADAVGREPTALSFVLRSLVEAGWIHARPDPLHAGRVTYVLTEPIVRVHRVVLENEEARLSRNLTAQVWEDAGPRIASLIDGPHLEWMSAEWALQHASGTTIGGAPRAVAPGVLRAGGATHQIDLVAVQAGRRGRDEVIAIGEANAGPRPVGVGELDRLDMIVRGLGDRGAATVRRLVIARGGFTAELRRAARSRADVELVDLERLYHGD